MATKRDRKSKAASRGPGVKRGDLQAGLPAKIGWDLDRPAPARIARARLFPGVAFLVAAIHKCGGNLSEVARLANVGRSTVHEWLQEVPELQTARDEAREAFVDELEDLLIDQARKGNIAAIIFGLKTQGKARGYIESNRLEVSGTVTTRERNPQADARYLAEVAAAYAELPAPGGVPGLLSGREDGDVVDGEFEEPAGAGREAAD
jgi:hypothetical protein